MKAENRFAFSKTRLEALPIPDAGRVYHYDEKTPGLALCVTASGTRTFYLYRWVDKRPVRVRIGPFPALTIDQARKLAAGLNVAIAAGHDPQETKRARREEPALRELWEYWLAHSKGRKRPRSIEEDERNWKLHLEPWAGRRLSSIKRQDVAALHTKLGNGHPHRANRVLALLRAMFNRAEDIGWKGENPASRIELFPEQSRDRFLLPSELPAFFQALAADPNPLFQGFFLLSLLTGARRANLQAMRWPDVSFELRQWRIPETKAGIPVVVPLTPLAVEVLEKLKEYRRPDCEWVFPGRRLNGGHIISPGFAWKRLLKRAGLKDLRLHDLRRSLGSWQALSGASLQIIGKSLGHTRPETTAIYSRLTLDPVRESVEKATEAIRVAAGGKLPKIGENGGQDNDETQD